MLSILLKPYVKNIAESKFNYWAIHLFPPISAPLRVTSWKPFRLGSMATPYFVETNRNNLTEIFYRISQFSNAYI